MLSASLCACENAFESLDVGEWQQVGSAAAPAVGVADNTRTEDISAGAGPAVRPGDLVKVRISGVRARLPRRSAGHANEEEPFSALRAFSSAPQRER
jgi:hypothetical protein